MKILIFLFAFLSLSTYASEFTCRPINFPSKFRLKFETELHLKNGQLLIDAKTCTGTSNDKYTDICSVGKSTLFVSVQKKLPSLLILSSGSVFKLECDDQPREESPSRQQQHQEQESEGPGHGGNTVGH